MVRKKKEKLKEKKMIRKKIPFLLLDTFHIL
jgi:hypothetical protein